MHSKEAPRSRLRVIKAEFAEVFLPATSFMVLNEGENKVTILGAPPNVKR